MAMQPQAPARGECPVCGDQIALKQNGTLRHHDDKRKPTNLPFHDRCAGAGSAPKEA